ncbi:hypothetical protein FOW48_18240 [Bacillus paranthracis]|nr:hypothetical protein FOW48_18240 [Bacillus paranthracis]
MDIIAHTYCKICFLKYPLRKFFFKTLLHKLAKV